MDNLWMEIGTIDSLLIRAKGSTQLHPQFQHHAAHRHVGP